MTLRFFFDFISPYAYLAWCRVHALADTHDRCVEPVPILFAGVLNAWGQLGPAEIPPKRVHVMKDCLRQAARHGVTLRPPPTHPFNPLLALRIAGLDMPADTRRRLIDGLYAAVWGSHGGGVEDPSRVAAIADAAGLDGAAAVAAAGQPDAKARLRASTEAAIAAGVFGVPTTDVDGELFWGFDSFPHIERYLAGDDPVDPTLVARWTDLPASAQRR